MKMKAVTEGLLFFICLTAASQALTPSTYLSSADKLRLKGLFLSAQPYTDVATAYYSILGLSLLGEAVPKTQEVCDFLKSKANTKALDISYYIVSASKLLGNCQLPVGSLQPTLDAAIKEDASIQDLFYGVSALKALGKPVDSAKVSKILAAALKRDDNVLNLGYGFHVASQLQGDLTPFTERIEDAIVQADELDGKLLQFEGGLSITAVIISGVYRLAEASKKSPAITGEQTIKFTNYFLSRKFVQVVKGASQLLEVLKILVNNKYHIPVAMTLASNGALSVQNPVVKIRVTNILGESLGSLAVTADSALRLADDSTLFSKKVFTPVQGDSSLYAFNFLESKPRRGFYTLTVSAVHSKPDLRFIGNTGAKIQVKVMTEIGVESVEVGIVDRDQATAAKTTKVEFGKRMTTSLEADHHQKLLMRFVLRDKNGADVMAAHQTFIQLNHLETQQEIVFVAEPDSSNIYKFDLDLHSKAKEFGYLSGKYTMGLIVGDAVIANPFTWIIGDIVLTFPQNPNPQKTKEDPYIAKPEIKHLFRQQEKRPAAVVTQLFCVLLLVPLLLLFILWAKIGVNISNFPLSLSALGFHLGLAGIFGLFVMFWLQFNMFATLKYLSLLAVFTFLSGHSLLSHLANSKK